MGKVTLPHRNGDFMANVYIEEFPIDKNLISKEYISSIVYVNNKYYVIQYNKLYELDIVTGHFNNIKDLAKNLYPNDNDYLILKVDLSKNNFKVKLFLDPAYDENGVFTKENISPKCLSIFQL